MAGGIKPPLAVKSDTLVQAAPRPAFSSSDVDAMPLAFGSTTADAMPRANPAAMRPAGPAVQHFSWASLQAGGTPMVQTQHQPMTGAVQKNKAPF